MGLQTFALSLDKIWTVKAITGCLVILLGMIGTWGLWRQRNNIVRNKSGHAVSRIAFLYMTFHFSVMTVYGFSIPDAPLVINGLLRFLFHLPILAGLQKYKGFTRNEKRLALVLAAMLVLVIRVSFKQEFFLIENFGAMFIAVAQPLEIWREKNSGVVEIRLVLIYLCTAFAWVFYGLLINDWAVWLTSAGFFAVWVVTAGLWRKYRQKKRA